jgi:hypothetical protein
MGALALSSVVMLAQPTPASVKQYLSQMASGWAGDAKKALPDLLIDYPDDPAVTFLHASLVEDAKRAKPLFERIVAAYPKSEYADDALLRLIIEAATSNEGEQAKKLFLTMREQYSQSELLWIAHDVLRTTVGVPAAAAQKVAPARPAELPSEPTKTNVAVKKYSLRVRSTENKTEANTVVEQFKKKRMKARVVQADKVNRRGDVTGSEYIVLVGEFETAAEAKMELKAVSDVCKCKATVYSK